MKLYSTLLLFLFALINSSLNASHINELPETAPGTVVACNGFTYCASNGNNANLEWCESFELGTINNVSGTNDGYADFTNLSTDLTIGDFYTVTCTPGYSGTTYTEFFRVWIDYNADGDFDDIGELVLIPEETMFLYPAFFLFQSLLPPE